jgi:ABC-type antimicrobial peptide transport system permease subunit
MARVFWPGENAIGKCVIAGSRTDPCSTVIGVASDGRRMGVIEPRSMFYYLPAAQRASSSQAYSTIVVRTHGGQAARIAGRAERVMRAAIPGLDGVSVRTLASVVERDARPWKLGAALFSGFGVLAFVVAGVGVYSVAAFGVAQRSHEMGIRLALGAQRRDIADLVIADGLRDVLVGVAIGIATALALVPFVRSLLFGVTPTDPPAFIAAATALCALAAAASVVPALRASRLDPAITLRGD